MDRASQVLAQGVPPVVPASYRALTDHGNVPQATLHHRALGRLSIDDKAQANTTSTRPKIKPSLILRYKWLMLDDPLK